MSEFVTLIDQVTALVARRSRVAKADLVLRSCPDAARAALLVDTDPRPLPSSFNV